MKALLEIGFFERDTKFCTPNSFFEWCLQVLSAPVCDFSEWLDSSENFRFLQRKLVRRKEMYWILQLRVMGG